MTRQDPEYVRLASRDWVTLILVIAGAAVSTLGLNYRLHLDALDRIDALDEKWQVRMADLARDIRTDLKEVKESTPPDWFRNMVESNSRQLEALRERILFLERSVKEKPPDGS